jgi:hypothetical protein
VADVPRAVVAVDAPHSPRLKSKSPALDVDLELDDEIVAFAALGLDDRLQR